MKLKSLSIRRTESYQTPANTLVGTVTLVDEGQGEQTIVLASAIILKICKEIASHVENRAIEQARQAGGAMREAAAEIELSEFAALEHKSEG